MKWFPYDPKLYLGSFGTSLGDNGQVFKEEKGGSIGRVMRRLTLPRGKLEEDGLGDHVQRFQASRPFAGEQKLRVTCCI